jgi:DNA-binding LacI/PurR family transcriptional regulator
MASSIIDVARLARVSTATVSRVLSNKPHVRENVRERVLQAVKELGYQPSRVARSLRVQTSQIIGLIISDIQNPYFTSLVRAVEDRAYKHDYAIILCNSDENPLKEALYIDLMRAEQVAGVIITPTNEIGSNIQKLLDGNIPVVAVDRRIAGHCIDTVILDNIGAARHLVNLLLDQGHQRIGAILGSPEITTGRERYQGFELALNQHNIRVRPEYVRTGPPKEYLGYQCTNELLDLPTPPTALFLGNNLLTLGAIRAIHDRKLSIPQDLSLACFDDPDWASLIIPRLMVVEQPTYEMGQAAADLILQRIVDGNRPAQEIVFKPRIYTRESAITTNSAEISRT